MWRSEEACAEKIEKLHPQHAAQCRQIGPHYCCADSTVSVPARVNLLKLSCQSLRDANKVAPRVTAGMFSPNAFQGSLRDEVNIAPNWLFPSPLTYKGERTVRNALCRYHPSKLTRSSGGYIRFRTFSTEQSLAEDSNL